MKALTKGQITIPSEFQEALGIDNVLVAASRSPTGGSALPLDRRHLVTPAVRVTGLPLRVMTPGDFLNQIASGELK